MSGTDDYSVDTFHLVQQLVQSIDLSTWPNVINTVAIINGQALHWSLINGQV